MRLLHVTKLMTICWMVKRLGICPNHGTKAPNASLMIDQPSMQALILDHRNAVLYALTRTWRQERREIIIHQICDIFLRPVPLLAKKLIRLSAYFSKIMFVETTASLTMP